ncbi:MAG: cupin domain-containing protein [Candidatus Hodarchaeota archaeon]
MSRYPEIITNLPKASINIPGIQGWIAQGINFQIIFFEIEPVGKIPPHSHGAQFGIVLEGEMSLTIGTETKKYTKGDTYYIPNGTVHQAEFHSFFRAMDFFEDAKRYSTLSE